MLGFILELLLELLAEILLQLFAELLFELGFHSVAHSVRRGRTANPLLAAIGLFIIGALAGFVTCRILPHPLLRPAAEPARLDDKGHDIGSRALDRRSRRFVQPRDAVSRSEVCVCFYCVET